MLFYMQMRNWFLIFLMLTIVYLVHQKSNPNKKFALRNIQDIVSITR